ncbi:MAG: DUF2191 domain-containing protein [bacterium]
MKPMKRTTLTVPRDLIDELVKATGAKNKTQAVILAIQDEIKSRKKERIRQMAGHLEFTQDADEIRHGDHRLG